MIDEATIRETERRFYQERGMARDAVRMSPPRASVPGSSEPQTAELLNKNSNDQIAKRLNRVRAARPELQPAPAVDQPAIESSAGRRPDVQVLERIFGRNDLLGIGFLDHGVRASRAVGRVQVVGASGQILGFGTGFLVSPQLLLTNNHVLPDLQTAANSKIEFNYVEDDEHRIREPLAFPLDPSSLFLTDPALDYTLVMVRGDRLLERFGFCRLIEDENKVLVGEFVNIIQHPGGQPMKVALRQNQVDHMFDNFLQYQTDTAPGSSGSPVFNDQWELVALHHSGVPERDAQGRILTINGSPFVSGMSDSLIKWITNEGIRISRIVRALKAQRLGGRAVDLIGAALDAGLGNGPTSTPPNLGPRPGEQDQTSRPIDLRPSGSLATVDVSSLGVNDFSPGQEVTFTIPVQLTVRIGNPIAVVQGSPMLMAPGSTPGEPAGTGDEVTRALSELAAARARSTYYDAETDRVDRDAYYRPIDREASSGSLFSALHDLLVSTHRDRLPYKPSTFLYPVVDLRVDGMLRSIYSGRIMDPAALIRNDAAVSRALEHAIAALKAREATADEARLAPEIAALEASMPLNAEHSVPQSWFEKRNPMRGDLHHLFSCEPECNSFRGNTPYFDFSPTDEATRSDCGRRETNKFEPEGGRGEVARATLYFLIRYPGEINRRVNEYTPDRISILKHWCETIPVTEYELHRNREIFLKQGNRNPLIDFPEWVGRIDFLQGLGP